jgi:transposase-like protein
MTNCPRCESDNTSEGIRVDRCNACGLFWNPRQIWPLNPERPLIDRPSDCDVVEE